MCAACARGPDLCGLRALLQPLGLLVDPLKDESHELHQRNQERAEGEAAQVEAHLGTYGRSLEYMRSQPRTRGVAVWTRGVAALRS